jgi:glutamate synthase (NADPH/NADH) small chain
VVGGGPAGVTCALELARAGVQVTLFESLHRLGGVLSYGIPVFRLPDEVVDRELAELDRLGVQVETNAVVGRTLTVDELLGERGFDAVFLGVGAGLPKLLGVPGENLAGVLCANEYLTRVNLMGAYDFPEHDTPVLRGRNAVVLGGGNVAMDAARTALRLGAETVTLCYRRTEAEMPARRAEVEHAKEEGVRFLELVSPLGFEGDERGCVRTARFAQMELGEPDEGGRRRPVEAVGAVPVELPCDLAITAIGTNASPLVPLMAPGLELSERGYIVADEDGRTSDPRIWAGGDIVTGAATVILAMGAGKKAAASIVKTLRDGR